MLLLVLFVIFQILYPITCQISCYSAPMELNYNYYIMTADSVPTELQDTILINNSMNCFIEVIWQRNPRHTKIGLIAETGRKAVSSNHKLQIDIGYENRGSISIWEQFILYQCNTNLCNNLNQLKRLLNSLTIHDTLIDLVYLLTPIQPFESAWCYRASNATFQTCNTTIPDNLCKGCELIGLMNKTDIEICATCINESSDKFALGYGKFFNMIDRTYVSTWGIICGRQQCNIPMIGDIIREKSFIDFDFNKFLN